MKRRGFLLWEIVSYSKFSNVQPVKEKLSFFKTSPTACSMCAKKERNSSEIGLVGEGNLFFLMHLVYSLKICDLTHGSLIRVSLTKNLLLISFLCFHSD